MSRSTVVGGQVGEVGAEAVADGLAQFRAVGGDRFAHGGVVGDGGPGGVDEQAAVRGGEGSGALQPGTQAVQVVEDRVGGRGLGLERLQARADDLVQV